MARPRFIAGAVCPDCGEMDRLVLEQAADTGASTESPTRRRCVSCGYSDELTGTGSREPKTRLGAKHRAEAEDEARPVRIVGPVVRSTRDES